MATAFSSIRCKNCGKVLARLYAGHGLAISFRCPRCKALTMVTIRSVVAVVLRAEPVKPTAEGFDALPRVHPVRLAGN